MPAELTRFSDLADRRKANGVSLEAIERSTLIGRHFLEAIEAEDFSKLPGGVYTTSYLRQYARASGYDESALLRRYYKLTEPQPLPEPVASPSWLSRWLHECATVFSEKTDQRRNAV